MASGKTTELIWFSRSTQHWPQEPREQRPRDRSLSGKARVRVRKAANKRG